MRSLIAALQQRLDKRKNNGNYRRLISSSVGSIDFASNDYLGFLHDGILDGLMKEEPQRANGWGAGGSRLLTGHSLDFDRLEQEIVLFHRAEAGLIFNSGYNANLGLLSSITSSEDTIIYDQEVHASLHDAVRISRAQAYPFRHNDPVHLSRRLQQAGGRIFVCVDSVYSCNGLQSPLAEIAQICREAGAHLIVDEAHATGWLGEKGEGAVQLHGLQKEIFARVHTFSKALGGQGAIVLGSSVLREYLINFARPFIYTTALPSYSLAMIRCAYRALELFQDRQLKLHGLIDHFRKKCQDHGFSHEPSHSPIQCFPIPGNEAVKNAARGLQSEGFNVLPLLSPTVRRGKECLRICLHAFNTKSEIDELFERLNP